MNDTELVALYAVGLWLLVLSVVVVLTVRQVAILTIQAEQSDKTPALDGLTPGSDVPSGVGWALPELAPGASLYLLVLGADCLACRQLAEGLRGAIWPVPVAALLTGDPAVAKGIADLLPEVTHVLADPEGDAVASLHLQTTPFVFEVTNGQISAKNNVRNRAHLLEFLERGQPTKNHRPLEVITHGT